MEIQEHAYMDCDDEFIEELYFESNCLSVYSKKIFYWILYILIWFVGVFSKDMKTILFQSWISAENSTSSQYDNRSSSNNLKPNGLEIYAPSGQSDSKDKLADSTEDTRTGNENSSSFNSLVGLKPHEKKDASHPTFAIHTCKFDNYSSNMSSEVEVRIGDEASAPDQGQTCDNLPEPAADETKNTLVIKNLPFKFKQTDLDKMLSDYEAKPKNVRLLRDDSGKFSGIAFIRCPSKEEAARLITCMNNLDVGGRSIQVEFKKRKKKSGKLSASGALMSSSEYPNSLTSSAEDWPNEARSLSSSAEYVNEAKQAQPFPVPQPQQQAPAQAQTTPAKDAHKAPSGKVEKTEQKPKQSIRKSGQVSLASVPKRNILRHSTTSIDDELRQNAASVGPGSRRSSVSYYPPSYQDSDGHAAYPNSAVNSLRRSGNIVNNLPSIRPIRQPIVPDGKTNGFSLEYRNSRTVRV